MLKQLSPHVYYLPFDKANDRPNIGYIHGQNFSVLIDVGNSPAHLEMMLKELDAHQLPHPEFAIITHWHWDHTFAMHAFEGTTMAHIDTNEILKNIALWEWDDDAMKARLQTGEECEFCDTHIRIEYDDLKSIHVKTADIVFNGDISMDLGNMIVETKRIINSHSDDGIVVYAKNEGVLFVGDADSGEYYKLDGGFDPVRFHHYVGDVSKINFSTYVHGHLDPMNRAATFEEWQRLATEEVPPLES